MLVVMDGVGLAPDGPYNAMTRANLETLPKLMSNYPFARLGAAGTYVGIPAGNAGNSEVGHNAMGAGQIVLQRSAAVDHAVKSGKIFASQTWQDIIKRLNENHATLHFMGILSDGNVHSHIAHLEAMLKRAHEDGIKRVRLHALFDGRDVAPQSEPRFIHRFENFVASLPEADYRLASGGGRMLITADRYGSDWRMVERGWRLSVLGEGRQFANASEAIEILRRENPGLQDQYIPPFVIAENGQAIGTINDGDAVIYFDFRADRALEISQAFTYNDFPHFDRIRRPEVYFAGMTEYNEDLHVPEHTLVASPVFDYPLSFHLAKNGIHQYALSETVKFGHITYYFNGNRYVVPENEVEEQVNSYLEPFNTRPWMRSAEITDKLVDAISSQQYQFLRVNFPGGDMVGHFAEMLPTEVALSAIDICLKRIVEAVRSLGGVLIITADHGNAEEIADASGAPRTAHTANPVPCIFVDDTANATRYHLKEGDFGLANLAATISFLLGVEPDQHWLPGLLDLN